MAKNQYRSIRKVSGKKYVAGRKQRSSELGNEPTMTHIGQSRTKIKRTLGGNTKRQILVGNEVIIADGKKAIKATIESVIENPANINYTRRNIVTKGSIVKTNKGDVTITSRPGQSGTLFGKLI